MSLLASSLTMVGRLGSVIRRFCLSPFRIGGNSLINNNAHNGRLGTPRGLRADPLRGGLRRVGPAPYQLDLFGGAPSSGRSAIGRGSSAIGVRLAGQQSRELALRHYPGWLALPLDMFCRQMLPA